MMIADSVKQLNAIYGDLNSETVKKLVLVGEPGVGKTLMARKLSARAIKEGKFDLTLWVFLNRKCDDKTLFESIASQLSLLPVSEEWEADDGSNQSTEKEANADRKHEECKAKISEALQGKKLLLILDDEGNRMTEPEILSELKALLPLDEQASYKVLITKAINRGGTPPQGTIIKEVHPLSEDEALSLLQENVETTVYELPGMKDLAKYFIEKSKKLPHEIIIMAKALSYFGNIESGMWKLESLKEESELLEGENFNAINLLSFGDELLPKSILIDCCCNDNHFIHKRGGVHYNELISYWILEGYLGYFDCIEKAYEMGHSVLLDLLDFGILKHLETGCVSLSGAKYNLDTFEESEFVGATRLGLATLLEDDLGKILLANGVIRTVRSGKGQKKLSTLLIDVSHLSSEVPDDFFQFRKELEVLAIFNPGLQPLPLPLFHMQDLLLLVLRGCDALEDIDHILKFERPTTDSEISDPGTAENQLTGAQLSGVNSSDFLKHKTTTISQTSNPFVVLKKLTALEISGPSSLKTIPDFLFYHMPQLRSVNLSLLQIESLPSSLYNLEKLVWLILRGCSCLQELRSLKRLVKLQVLDLSGATSFKSFYDKSLSSNRELQVLNLSQSRITSLPLIRDLKNLTHLLLSGCTQLERLRKITALSSLQILDLSDAEMFKEFPDPSLEQLHSLKVINISRTAVDKLPVYISSLHHLYASHCSQLKELPHIEFTEGLQVLDLSGTCNLEDIKESFFHRMTCLRVLNLSETSIKSVPALSSMSNLRHLFLSRCLSLETLGELNSLRKLEILDLSGCKNLKGIQASSFEHMHHLQKLDLSETNITRLPSLSEQSNLRYLRLKTCSNLTDFPALEHLSRLEELNLSGVRSMAGIGAAFVQDMVNLHTLDLSGTWIEKLPSLLNLKNLKYLSLRDCPGLTEVPGLEALTKLEVLDLSGTAIKDLPSLENFGNLEQLLLKDCSSLEKFKNLQVLQVLEAANIELPYGIAELTRLQHLELPLFGVQEPGDVKTKSLLKDLRLSLWSISNWPAESTTWNNISIAVKDFQILQFLEENPTIWEKALSKFHFCVHPVEDQSRCGDKNFYRNELFLRYNFFQTRQLSSRREQNRLLEIRGFHNFPRSLEFILSHTELVFLIDNRFVRSLSCLGNHGINEMKACWIERCSEMEYVLLADKVEDTAGSGERAKSKLLKKDDAAVLRMAENLEILRVSNASNMKSICSENLESTSLKNLKCLCLEYCPEISKVFSSLQQLQNLETLQVRFCHKLVNLFEDEAPALPKLHTLQLWALPNLKSIGCILSSLQSLEVGECPMLVSLLSLNQPLDGLKNLQIKFCDRLETIFEPRNETLPNLQKLCLWDLPELKTIGTNWSSSVDKIIRQCPKLLQLPIGTPSGQ